MKRLGWQSLNKLLNSLKDENGSAVIEFVVLALPLYVPFALYLGVIHSQSQSAFDAHNLARQAARAFITSPSEALTQARVDTVVQAFSSEVLAKHGITAKPVLSVQCGANPCLTPDAEVKVTVTLADPLIKPSGYLRFFNSTPSKVVASDTQIVDAWRNNG
jgi:Flp pilus assembly protein TadG